jgi:hypothetical protein
MPGSFDVALLGGAGVACVFCAWLAYTGAGSTYRRNLRKALVGEDASWKSVDWHAINREGLHALALEEFDRIRAKAEASGIRALSDEERAFVHRLRQLS